jgi:hypothetical protein
VKRIFSISFVIVFFSIVLFIFPSRTISVDFCSDAKTTSIYFVNGIWATRANAEKGRIVIEKIYKQKLENQYPSQTFEFKLAYNYHIDTVRDVIEVIGQKIAEINNPGVSRVSPEVYFAMYTALQNFKEVMPLGADPIILTIEEAIAARITAEVNSSALIQKYESDMLEGKRVLLIAHSQGNMFAGDAMEALSDEFGESIGMIGVASPAARLYGNQSTYYTAHDDRVINLLRTLFPVLRSNVDNDPGIFNDPRDFSNHQLIRSYLLEGLASRSLIDADVSAKISQLVFPYAYLGSGAITVTLTWGAEPDVDLHIIEPNGNQVYYGNMSGLCGYLDLDDITSYGPEHYYVSCGGIREGTFKIGVNYFRGYSPEVAQIQVSTSDGITRTFRQDLPVSHGSSGNSSPIIVAFIDVSIDAGGNYIYNVHQ